MGPVLENLKKPSPQEPGLRMTQFVSLVMLKAPSAWDPHLGTDLLPSQPIPSHPLHDAGEHSNRVGAFASLCPWGELGLMATRTGFPGSVSQAGVSVVYSPHANDSFSGWDVIAFSWASKTGQDFCCHFLGKLRAH